MNLNIEFYNNLIPDYPLNGKGEWDDVKKYVIDIDNEMKRKAYWLWDCHHYNLKVFYENYLEYWPHQGDNYLELNEPRWKYLRRAIHLFTTKLYDLKLIG